MILVDFFKYFLQTIFLLVCNELTDAVGIDNCFQSILELHNDRLYPELLHVLLCRLQIFAHVIWIL